MRSLDKLKYSVLGNLCILMVVILIAILCKDNSDYWNWGPSKNFVVVSVHIDTWQKYGLLMFLVALINVSRVVFEEIAMPILGFNIYNPDKKIITEFTKNQLQFYGNSMYLLSNIRSVFMTMLTISQIDIALYSVVVSEITTIYTIRLILNEKRFTALHPDELDPLNAL